MMFHRVSRRASLGAAALVLASAPPAALACATCFGDAQAPETRAAASAVIVLAAVVYVLLMGFGSVTLFWLVRARRRWVGANPTPGAKR